MSAGPVASASARRLRSLSGCDPHGYTPHALHGPERAYVETNCYTDVLIELLHAHGCEPLAMLGHLVRMDFEGDQWTFFKPAPEDLEHLFGVDIHEMQPYRPLPVQIAEQLERGRTIIVELDAWWLPDTASTSYRAEHVKTSVAADAIDPQAQVLWYFHNTGLHELRGEDYREVFTITGLPPYTELVRFDTGPRLGAQELRAGALCILRSHLERRPTANPFESFGLQLARALPDLLAGGMDDYHAYAFATVRMAGAAFELLSDHVTWLFGPEQAPEVTSALAEIVAGCKALSFRLARRRPFDPSEAIASMAAAWEAAIAGLASRVG